MHHLFFRRVTPVGDYKKKDSWSLDRVKFEIEEIDKLHPLLTEIWKNTTEDIIYLKGMEEESLKIGNLDNSKEFSEQRKSAGYKLFEIEKQIGQNWEGREELVKILRNKL